MEVMRCVQNGIVVNAHVKDQLMTNSERCDSHDLASRKPHNENIFKYRLSSYSLCPENSGKEQEGWWGGGEESVTHGYI